MKVVRAGEIEADIVREPGAKHATVRRLIDTPDGADRFVMSLFELGRDGTSPPHHHDWEHEIYILSGTIDLEFPSESKTITVSDGDAIFIPRGLAHAFHNRHAEPARAITIAPAERPPIRNVFLSDQPYEFDNSAVEATARVE